MKDEHKHERARVSGPAYKSKAHAQAVRLALQGTRRDITRASGGSTLHEFAPSALAYLQAAVEMIDLAIEAAKEAE